MNQEKLAKLQAQVRIGGKVRQHPGSDRYVWSSEMFVGLVHLEPGHALLSHPVCYVFIMIIHCNINSLMVIYKKY